VISQEFIYKNELIGRNNGRRVISFRGQGLDANVPKKLSGLIIETIELKENKEKEMIMRLVLLWKKKEEIRRP